MKRFLTIDPGISGTGIAFFKNKKLIFWRNIYPIETDHFQKRADSIIAQIHVMAFEIDVVFCEWPTGRFSNAAGIAAHNSDAILKLTYLIGRLESLFDGGMTLIPVIKWKGNLKKHIVQKRAEAFFKQKGFTNHAADAVGIGQYCLESGLIK